MKPPDAKTILIRDMLATLEGLGNDHMARVDARLWARHYARAAKRLKISVKHHKTSTKSK